MQVYDLDHNYKVRIRLKDVIGILKTTSKGWWS
jgi:hypothetical protein